MSTKRSKAEDKLKLADTENILDLDLSAYPVDMSLFLTLPHCTFNAMGIPYHVNSTVHHPTTIAQYALAHWNQYLATNDEYHLKVFLVQASWFIEHETRIGEDSGGWLISFPHLDGHTRGPWLSALTQGSAISVLTRAYQLTHEEAFLEVARRAIHTFELDILDGGVSAPLGEEGVFFEEVAVYPAAHMLSGFIFALFGLYDYVALTGDAQIETLIHCSVTTMHHLLDEFDGGFWTCSDLLHRHLASPAHLELQTVLLEAIAKYSGCEHCTALALHWKSYLGQFSSRLRYLISNRCHALWHGIQTALFAKFCGSPCIRVCVPITGFPSTGGIFTVLAGVAQVTADIWQLEYLTQYIGGLHPEAFVIHRFGTAKMTPWQFPTVWLYFLAGFGKLITQLRHGANYHVILPQDGVFTAAFAALAAKLASVRVVCIDHGNLTLLKSRTYRTERIQALATKSWLYRLLARLLYVCYWPSLYLLACISARLVDHFLIPGVAGDGVEEVCKRLGVPLSRITRFSSMINIDYHIVLDAASKANIREKNGIAADAIVIAMVGRLAPEKGIDIALEAVSQALSTLPPDLCARVRFIVAGDGPLRKHLEEGIRKHKLDQTCAFWGDISAQDVISLLAISDIFLYTSTRGACFAMAVLEAMASGCAVIASTQPMANALLLAEGRGIAVPPNDIQQTSKALVALLNDLELCRRMGTLARDYIAVKHSAAMFRRTLMRVTYWSGLDEF